MADAHAVAFAPGHVTVFFGPHRRDDPERSGSTGAGITLTDGVTVRVGPGEGVSLNGSAVTIAAVERVLERFTPLRVEAETPLPIGAGFGVSGACALGTAFGANAVTGAGRTENDLIAIAHRADVEAATGLGDVVAQARGGIPLRLEPGAPPHGVLDGIPGAGRIEYRSFGAMDTAAVLAGDADRLREAAERGMERVLDRPALPVLFAAGRRFSEETDLGSSRTRSAIEAVRTGGGEAAMAMLGETVIALGSGLSEAGIDASACRVHPTGAGLRPPEP